MSETNTNNQNQQNNGNNQQNQQGGNQTQPEFDYDKLAGIIAGKQKADEEMILRNRYFRFSSTG